MANFFDDEDILEDQTVESKAKADDFFEGDDVLESEYVDPEEMGAAEAALTGFGSGASFGLTPIIGGIAGAGAEAVEDIGDVLGLTEDEKLREQGFKLEDDKPGLEGLLKAYYESRDLQKAQEDKSFKDQPVASILGNVAGGISSFGGAAKLASGLAKGGKAAQAASKILPKAESVTGMGLAQKAGIGLREGAKAGALTGFGSGEGRLLEGELGEVAKETAGTALAGGLLGGGLPIAGAGIKKTAKTVSELPFIESIGLGFKAGKKGIDIGDESQVVQHITEIADEIRSSISKNFKGASKDQLLKEADEIGIRVAAGESVEDVIAKIKKEGAFDKKSQKQLTQFVEDLKSLSEGYDPALEKAVSSIEKNAAKKAMKIVREGGSVETRTPLDAEFDELVPLPDRKGKVIGVEDKFVDAQGDASKNLTTASLLESEVPLKQYDLSNMKLSELDEVIRKLGNKAYSGTDDASNQYGKELYKRLREASNEALESSSLPERNKKLKSMFDALETLGVDPKEFFSNQETVKDKVQKTIFQKITSGSLAGDLDINNFTKYMGRADERLAEELKEKASFAKDLGKFVSQSEGEGSISIKAVAGPIQKVLAKTGGLGGSAAKTVGDIKSAIYKRMADITPEQALEFSSRLGEMYGQKAEPFINALTKAASAQGTRKTALMYGIYQQPAFRKMLEDAGRKVLAEEKEEYDNSETADNLEFTPVSDESKKKVGREPQSTKEISSFFTKQTDSVSLDNIDTKVLSDIEEVSKNLGYDNMVLSSGTRDVAKTKDLLEQRKNRENITDLNEEESRVVDRILMRGDSPDNIEYPMNKWYSKAFSDLSKIGRTDLIDKIGTIRRDFGGYESGHLSGKKVDIPYSFFVNKYGKEEGVRKAKEFIEQLKEKGLKVIDEPNAGQYGVIDITRGE